MGHSHSHARAEGHAGVPTLRVPAGTRRVLIGVVALLAVLTAAAAVWLWPKGPAPHTATIPAVQQDTLTATVVSVNHSTCAGTTDDRLVDGSVAPTVACAAVKVRLTDGPSPGKVVTVQVTGPAVTENLAPGVKAVVARFPDVALPPGSSGSDGANTASGASGAGTAEDVYAWVDFDRATPMWLLLAVFVVVVVAVARLRGLAALAGVGAGFAMILLFLLPALRHGENPVAVTLVGSIAIMIVVLYASHGVSAKTTCALFGTVIALAASAGLATWAASAAHLDGQTGEDALSLTQLVGAGTISAAVISGMLLAGLGVLNDVTVTQASAVWELKAAASDLDARALFARGMRIGRDHLASTVYTVAFAYAGVSLTVLLLIQVYDRPITEVLTSAPIAQDVVGLMVGAIGLTLAIPLTTAVAALVAAKATATAPVETRASEPAHAPVSGPGSSHRPVAVGGESDGEEIFEEGVLFRAPAPPTTPPGGRRSWTTSTTGPAGLADPEARRRAGRQPRWGSGVSGHRGHRQREEPRPCHLDQGLPRGGHRRPAHGPCRPAVGAARRASATPLARRQ